MPKSMRITRKIMTICTVVIAVCYIPIVLNHLKTYQLVPQALADLGAVIALVAGITFFIAGAIYFVADTKKTIKDKGNKPY